VLMKQCRIKQGSGALFKASLSQCQISRGVPHVQHAVLYCLRHKQLFVVNFPNMNLEI